MSLLASVADIFLGGGASGVISGGVSMYAKLKELKEANRHKEKEWGYTLHMTRENAKHETALAERQLLISKQVGADEMRTAAIVAERGLSQLTNVSPWVNNVRSLHRPMLTYLLILGVIWVYLVAREQALAGVEPSESQVLLTVFICNAAASAVGFWFGDRVIAATSR